MRNVITWALAVGVAVAVTTTASAQQRQGRGGMFGRGGMSAAMLLGNEGVQKELKLTDEQKEKAREFAQAQGEKMREAFQNAQGDPEKMQEARKAMTEAGDKFVKETLKPEQQKRLKQIQYQADVLQTLSANEEVQKTLKLTDEQKEKLKTLADDLRKDRQELFQGGGGPEMMQKMQALTKDYTTKAQAVLTDAQKKEWKDLTGDPFELQMQFGRRRGGGQ
jgi:Spy/CpxP family protein refolding chaperone